MSARLRVADYRPGQQTAGPVYRLIVAVDLEGSTTRSNPVKGELRRVMYDLLEHALDAVPITADHLEPPTDRGDGVLLLIRPHDDVPKTALLDRLIPHLAELLAEHNETVKSPAARIRLRAVVHAGEVHGDSRGFYGEAIDVAIRLLDSASLKSTLRQSPFPLVLVVSNEIYSGIVAHGYLECDGYRPLVRVRVAGRRHCGWVHIPSCAVLEKTGTSPCDPPAELVFTRSRTANPRFAPAGPVTAEQVNQGLPRSRGRGRGRVPRDSSVGGEACGEQTGRGVRLNGLHGFKVFPGGAADGARRR